MHYLYYILKVYDLLDTLFFVLRKKTSHISFLHVYHHFFVTLVAFVTLKFVPGGQLVFLGLANTAVHAVMYFYYFITAWNPTLKQSLWWKKHITQLQLVRY